MGRNQSVFLKSKNQLFSIFAILRRRVLRVAGTRGPSATQRRKNIAAMSSRYRHCVDLTGPGMGPKTSSAGSGIFYHSANRLVSCILFEILVEVTTDPIIVTRLTYGIKLIALLIILC